jgi:hypothetical protein
MLKGQAAGLPARLASDQVWTSSSKSSVAKSGSHPIRGANGNFGGLGLHPLCSCRDPNCEADVVIELLALRACVDVRVVIGAQFAGTRVRCAQ